MDKFFTLTYILFIIGTLSFSLLMNLIFLKFVKSLGIRNIKDTVIRWNESSRPSIGGLSFYIIFLLSISSISFAFNFEQSLFSLREVGILGASSLGFLMGLSDDAYDTKPILKSLTQVACGLILALTGTVINLFDSSLLNVLLTVVWVIGIMNSINMLDNMDGITASVSVVILLTMVACFLMTDYVASFYFILISGIICALFGFLFFNWYPAKMFMGDSGSQFLGVFLAAMGIIFFWNLMPLEIEKISTAKKIIMPILAFIVPISDTTTVVINRLFKGRSPFIGGKDHTTHNLARIGLSDQKVAISVTIISLISGIIILYTYNDTEFSTGRIVGLSFYILLVFGSLFSVTQIKRKNTSNSESLNG